MADLYVEIKKDVNLLSVIIDMEKIITKVANYLRLDLSNIAEYPALTVTGEFSGDSLGIDVSEDDLFFHKNLIPYLNNTYIIGNNDNRWKEVHCMSLFVNGVEAGPNPIAYGIPMALSTAKLDMGWLNANVIPGVSILPISDVNGKLLTSWLYASSIPTADYLVMYNSSGKIDNSALNIADTEIIVGNGLTGGGPITGDIHIDLLPPASCSTITTNIATASGHTHQITGVLPTSVDVGVGVGILKSGTLGDGTLSLYLDIRDEAPVPPGGGFGETYGGSTCSPSTVNVAYNFGGHQHKITGFALTAHAHAGADITSGTLSGLRGVLSGDVASSFVRYTGTTKTEGAFYGGSTAPTDVTTILNYAGYFYAARVYNAVYNDYAECFNCKFENNIYITAKHIMEINDNNEVVLATNESKRVIGVVSDTYGYLLNGTDLEIEHGTKVPIAMSGTVQVITKDKNIDNSKLGKFVVSAGEGYCKTIEYDEVNNHVGEIIGKVIGIINNNTYKVLVCIN